jgi:hypothetical protein
MGNNFQTNPGLLLLESLNSLIHSEDGKFCRAPWQGFCGGWGEASGKLARFDGHSSHEEMETPAPRLSRMPR